MKKRFLFLCLFLGLFHQVSASGPGVGEENQSLLRSLWKPSTPVQVPKKDRSYEFFDSSGPDGVEEIILDDFDFVRPKHSDAYLPLEVLPSNPDCCLLYAKFLVTYCRLVIDEKRYEVEPLLKEGLLRYDQYSLAHMHEYLDCIKLSRGMNFWLPSKDTPVLSYIRGYFSQKWPTIDMYADLEVLRLRSPLSAGYIDYLFKTNEPDMTIERILEQIKKKCMGSMARLDLMTLLALHAFGHGDMSDLNLAEKDLAKLRSFSGTAALEAIFKVMRSHYENVSRGLIFSDNDLAPDDLVFSDGEVGDLQFNEFGE